MPITLIPGAGQLRLTIARYLSMKRRSGDIEPWRAASVLVTDGAYAWTAIPAFSASGSRWPGTGLAFALDWLLILIGSTCVLVSLVVVRREGRFWSSGSAGRTLTTSSASPRYVFIR